MNRINKYFFSPLVDPLRRKAQRGIAAVEFALTSTVWLLLLLGGADCGYCLLINQRVDRVSYTVTDLITQSSSLTQADLSTILSSASQLMEPYAFSSFGKIVVSSVYKSSSTGATTILWQYSGGGTYDCGDTTNGCASRLGKTGQTPDMGYLNDMTLNTNDNVIVVEVFYKFIPMFGNAGIFSTNDIYRTSVYKPRLNALTTTPS